MPLVSAAVIATTVAITATSVATVATAAVALGTLVGTVGLGMSVVGAITKNKTLSKIGGYLGMAGGVMTLGGGLAGGFAGYAETLGQAWDDGVGSLFKETPAVGESALDSGALKDNLVKSAADNALTQQGPSASTTAQAPQVEATTLGPRPQPLPPPSASASATTSGANPLDFAGTAKPAGAGTDLSATQFANSAPSGAPADTTPLAQTTAQANTAPGVDVSGARQEALGQGIVKATQASLPQAGEVGSIFSKMPDWMKMQLAMTGAQGVAGALGSWFTSASAEKKLELERQAQQWYQDYQNKNQKFSQDSASYAPKVTFGNGLLNKGATT